MKARGAKGDRSALCCREVAAGLVYLHGKSHLHCDLSSGNVLLQSAVNTRGFICKISDMVRRLPPDPRLWPLLTPFFISPGRA